MVSSIAGCSLVGKCAIRAVCIAMQHLSSAGGSLSDCK
jgi:hypothetical protein